MNFKDILLMGLKNLLRRKARSILAITGVIIGTSAITVMMSLGIGLSQGFESQIKNWGNLHVIDVYKGYTEARPGQPSKEMKITDKSISELEKIPNVTAITPQVREYMKIAVGKYVSSVSIIGMRPEVIEKFNLKLADGRYLNKSDKMGIMFGKSAAMGLYNPYQMSSFTQTETTTEGEEKLPTPVVNAKVKITGDFTYGDREKGTKQTRPDGQPVEYTIYEGKGIGLLESENDDYTYSVLMNIEELKKIKEEKAREEGYPIQKTTTYEYDSAKIYVEDTKVIKEVVKAVKDKGYQTFSLIDMLEEVKKISGIIQAVLGGLGAISLLVAALGITNTMIMSIYERTKEIGIMKVIGANIKDIRRLFLVEAASIGFFGGVIGVLISYILSILTNVILGSTVLSNMGMMGDATKISVIPWYLALGSLLFATCVGILAGYIPANRAMNLSALESLRND